MQYESLIVVLAAGEKGSVPLDPDALDTLEGIAVAWMRIEREGEVGCLAARVRHPDPAPGFGERVRAWGRARGWAVTVAPSGPPC